MRGHLSYSSFMLIHSPQLSTLTLKQKTFLWLQPYSDFQVSESEALGFVVSGEVSHR